MKFTREQLDIGPSKLDLYLLNIDSIDGASKARLLFLFGFRRDDPHSLAEAIYLQATSYEISSSMRTKYVDKYLIQGMMNTPSGRPINLRTVWRKEFGEEIIKFVTLYPL